MHRNPICEVGLSIGWGYRSGTRQGLYHDHQDDPAFDPAFKTVLNKMDAQLTAELKASHDPRIEGHGALFDHYPTYNDPGFKRPDVI